MALRTTRLDSGWRLRGDPADIGLGEGWMERLPADGWKAAQVPGTIQGDLGFDGPPIVWYARTLTSSELATEVGQRVWLRFACAATEVTAWLDGRQVGHHVGDWVPFQFDLGTASGHAAASHQLVVRIDRIAPAKEVWIDGAPVQGGHLTKGFHDVLSVHKGGLWGEVELRVTGGLSLVPDGLGITADSRDGSVLADLAFERNEHGGAIGWKVTDAVGTAVAAGTARVAAKTPVSRIELRLERWTRWAPESPTLYQLEVELRDPDGALSEVVRTRFGFRRVEIGGRGGRQILLNGKPTLLRGVLDWGHEPAHIAPRPTSDELRVRFAALKARGFNLVCLCMWYPPPNYLDVADETGMLVWQEHPVWKSPMGDEHVAAYQEQFTRFFRRDRNHPSIVLVSGSCEHERFNPTLATWWWGEVRRLMPDRLAQVQTAFFAWTDLTKTDAYDEHTYDSSGRWTHYLEDLEAELAPLPPKPFVMGESILYVHWPEADELLGLRGPDGNRPWWLPRGLEAVQRFEAGVRARHGDAVLARFKAQARRYHLRGRAFQFERFRSHSGRAGLVMNHLRDVAPCRCGFQDERDRWYFEPSEMVSWLGESTLLLELPSHLGGLVGGTTIGARFGVSHYGGSTIAGLPTLALNGVPVAGLEPMRVEPGEVAWQSCRLDIPASERPAPLVIEASLGGATSNRWECWSIPAARPWPVGAARLDGVDFTAADRERDFEEKKYSSGWGSPVRSWAPLLPHPAELAPGLPPWRAGDARPGTRCLVAHLLTPQVVDFLVAGGCVVHLVSRAKGSPPASYVNLWGQLPLVLEEGPFGAGDSRWLADLLDHDLSRRSVRAIPVEAYAEHVVQPLVRLVYCHDLVDQPRLYDFLMMARVGEGLLIESGIDHSTPAGRYVLERLVGFGTGDWRTGVRRDARLAESLVRSWCVGSARGEREA